MKTNARWFNGSALAVLVAASSILAGCASGPLIVESGLEQQVQSASTRSDHEKIASAYELQAGVEKASAQRHERMARTYRQGKNAAAGIAAHCDNLSRMYVQTGDELLGLAKMHRQMAAAAKQ
jgi:hypothetical protein